MKTLSAALAAVLVSLACFAPQPVAAQQAVVATPINEYDHIRTTLHGSAGPLAVLIPGMSTPGAVWDDTVIELSDEMRLLVVEVRGMEGSRAPENERPGLIRGIVDNLAVELAARNLPAARIVGHSFGGLVALRFGLDHPAMAESLLVIDAVPFFGTVLDENATVASVEPQAARMRDMLLTQADTIRAAGARATDDPAGGAGMSQLREHQLRIANWSLKADPAVVAQALYEDMQMDLREEIAQLTMPVTVLYQASVAPELARERYMLDYAALSGVTLVPVERTSHFIMLDRPEIVRDAILKNGTQ